MKYFLLYRRSASSGPIDLLMDHDVDFIEDQIKWKWCLLAISGNATIVKLRRNDFVKYLKMNVASLVGSEYDFVRVTSISYTPYVLVNVSLDWTETTEPRIVKSLGGMYVLKVYDRGPNNRLEKIIFFI